MSDKILDICYEQAEIAAYEIGESNLSHLNKINSLFDNSIEYLSNIDSSITTQIEAAKLLVKEEQIHYTDVANMQTYFWAYIKGLDEELSSQLSSTFDSAMKETSQEKIYENIDMFKTLGILSILEKISDSDLVILNTSFILKGLLEQSSSKADMLSSLERLYQDGRISNEEYSDLLTYIAENNFENLTTATTDQFFDYIKEFLSTKSSSDVSAKQLWNTFKNVSSNLNNTLLAAASVQSADDILSYSVKFGLLKESVTIAKEQVTSIAYKYGVSFITTTITAADLWNGFNYDVSVIEMSETEAWQNALVDFGSVLTGTGGAIALPTIIALFPEALGLSAIPVYGWAIIGGFGLTYIYQKYLKNPVKEKFREFDDWKEQLLW